MHDGKPEERPTARISYRLYRSLVVDTTYRSLEIGIRTAFNNKKLYRRWAIDTRLNSALIDTIPGVYLVYHTNDARYKEYSYCTGRKQEASTTQNVSS